ncbi:DnaA ATPase domain-containing protein [Mycoplasma sp. 1654_15]|uniref:DnaA ATPase domain-containing protein n=1 Tax=Mycoplasma sp. 1654_15 TaxID=2725994 RepID=UPI001448A949|nr:prepilin peptidase [Mycoplasma sp. 1654_15]QJB70967.1 prepilin peptidase [Mycoplasma sp. 1654_15]
MKTNKISLKDVVPATNQDDFEKIKEFFIEKVTTEPEVQKIVSKLNISEQEINNNIDIFLNFLDQEPNAKFKKIIIRDSRTNALKIKLIESEIGKSDSLEKYILLKEISQISFDNLTVSFKENFLKQVNNEVKQKLSVLWKEVPKNKKWSFIYGPSLSGKTAFFKILAWSIVSKEKTIIYTNFLDLLNLYSHSISKKGVVFDIVNKLKKADYLLIEDFIISNDVSWFIEQVLNPVLDSRIKENKKIFISSLYNLNQIEQMLIENLKKEVKIQEITKFINRIKNYSNIYKL